MGGKKKSKSKSERNPGVQNEMSDMSSILSDPRFAHVAKDPKLRHVPKQQRKIKLDNRFSGVFTDDRFYETSTMDPRGKKGNFSTKEDLQKFYDMSSDEDTSDEEDDEDEVEAEVEAEVEGEVKESSEAEESDEELQSDMKKVIGKNDTEDEKLQTKIKSKNKSSKDSEESDVIPLEVNEVLKDMECDYARGAVFFSDDSSDDDSSSEDDSDNDDENQENKDEFEWGELDQNAVWDEEDNEVEETRRFAVCNMDWDRIKAADLMILFSSFCPREGSVESVTIYPSEYGKERMADEERYGPRELRTKKKGKNTTDAERDLKDLEKLEKGKLDEDDGTTKKHFESLRRYQRNRLLYYYAVIVCDAVESATIIYKHCDRQPFEGAGVLLDLRYIPDEMSFDDVPHDLCKEVPKTYEVRTFTTTALHDTRPTLTWDETNPDRKKTLGSAMNRAAKGEQVDQDQVQAFLASDSEEESEDEVSISGSDNENSEDEDEDKKAARIAKFRALINEIDEKERKKNEEKDEFNMEETFEYEEAKEKDQPENNKTNDKSDLTPFEKYLQKKKENKKNRKKKLKEEQLCSESESGSESESDDSNSEENEEEGEEMIMSDDELPDSMKDIYKDPFFSDEIKENKKLRKEKSKKKDNTEHGKDADGKLELLIMNEEEDEKKHFNMREIIKDANTKTTKNRWKTKKNKVKKIIEMKKDSKQEDDFKVDLRDSRFSAIMTSGEYNIDPSHPHFKRTKAMDGLINQVQQKRTADSMEDVPESKRHNIGNKKNKDELSLLVKKVKNKTKHKNK